MFGSSVSLRIFSWVGCLRSLIASPRCHWGQCHTVWFGFVLSDYVGTAGSTYPLQIPLKGQKRYCPSGSWCGRGPHGSFGTTHEIDPCSVCPFLCEWIYRRLGGTLVLETFCRLDLAWGSRGCVSLLRMVRIPMILFIWAFPWLRISSSNFLWWFLTVFLAAKFVIGIFLCSGVPNFATSYLLSTVSFCPGIFRVRVASVVFTNTVPSGTASYSPCKFFLLRVVAMFFLANTSLGLVFANGSSNLDDSILITRGMSPVSSFASFSFFAFASLISLSLSRSHCSHLSSLIKSSCPIMLSSKYA